MEISEPQSSTLTPDKMKSETPVPICYCDHSPTKAVLDYISKPSEKFHSRDEKILAHTARKKLKCSEDGQILRVKTKGQPLYFARVSKSRKSSNLAKSSLLKRRGMELGRIRKIVTGNLDASDVQLGSDLRRLRQSRKTRVCKSAGIRENIRISKEMGKNMSILHGSRK
jgi:hypothetical protein